MRDKEISGGRFHDRRLLDLRLGSAAGERNLTLRKRGRCFGKGRTCCGNFRQGDKRGKGTIRGSLTERGMQSKKQAPADVLIGSKNRQTLRGEGGRKKGTNCVSST